jgi:hypothetical protein
MDEHRIKLRGGWLWVDRGADGDDLRVTLPIAWPPGPAAHVRLVRPFRRPPIDPDREALALHLEAIDGLVAARLNDREVARPPSGTSSLWIALTGSLPERNVLVLDADPPRPSDASAAGSLWGTIALVIRPAEPPARACETLGGIDPSL